MFSIRNATRRRGRSLVSASLAGLVLGTAGGCQFKQEEPLQPVQARALKADAAMARRDWEPTVATYPSGAVVAGPTGTVYEPQDNFGGTLWEVPTFVTNVVLLPVSFAITPPWTAVIHRGIRTEPSYTRAEPYPEDIEAATRAREQEAGSGSFGATAAQAEASRAGTTGGEEAGVVSAAGGTGTGGGSGVTSSADADASAGAASGAPLGGAGRGNRNAARSLSNSSSSGMGSGSGGGGAAGTGAGAGSGAGTGAGGGGAR